MGVTIDRGDLEEWVGRKLTDEQVTRIQACVAHSSIPQAIAEIAAQFIDHLDEQGEAGTGENNGQDGDPAVTDADTSATSGNCANCLALIEWAPNWGAYLDESNDPFCPNGDHHTLHGESPPTIAR